jgi:hypothetical protein
MNYSILPVTNDGKIWAALIWKIRSHNYYTVRLKIPNIIPQGSESLKIITVAKNIRARRSYYPIRFKIPYQQIITNRPINELVAKIGL